MYKDKKIWFGMSGDEEFSLELKMANRHGIIAGATGTGKTTTLRTLAESFSDAGVPVFLADMKGDLAGMSKPGTAEGFVGQRMQEYGLAEKGFELHGHPVCFWDVYGEKGLPLRTTISEMGPVLLSRILALNDTQESVLTVVFKIADDNSLLLIDTKDLRAMLQFVSENAQQLSPIYGNLSKQSLTTIIRAVIALESAGAEQFFAEPALKITDWIARDEDGHGVINILDCQKLINNPTMYSTFMLWMLSELYETLPEVGDLDKPRIVYFFDEAHLLFNDAPKALLAKIEQVVKLVRSKGVGIFFITQSPKDVPDGVLAQLGNKIQHGLRAYTPAEQKKVRAVAESFRANPEFDTFDTLLNLGIGEAIVSTLDPSGIPTVVQRGIILPPQCSNGTIDDGERDRLIKSNDLYLRYSEYFDRDSAYEFFERKFQADAEERERLEKELAEAKEKERLEKEEERKAAAEAREEERRAAAEAREAERKAAAEAREAERKAAAEARAAERQAAAEAKAAEKKAAAASKTRNRVIKNVASSTGSTIGRELGKSVGSSIFGSTFGKTLGGNVGSSLGRGILGSLFGK